MINDKLFEKRLMAAKNGEQLPEVPKQMTFFDPTKEIIKVEQKEINVPIHNQPQKPINDFKHRLFVEIFTTISILITAFLYGIGISAIFSLDWNMLECLGVGLIASHLISKHIPSIFYWVKNKK